MIQKFTYGDFLYHFVTEFEEKEGKYFVYKRWSRKKKRWEYEVFSEYILNYMIKRNEK